MAAPTSSTRTNPFPGHKPYADGFSTTISPNSNPGIVFWERTVTPPAYDNEEKIPLTSMFNTLYRTFAGRKLITIGDIKTTAFWTARSYTDIKNVMGEANNGSWTVTLPNGDKIDVYAYLKSFTPKDNEEGKAPEADIELVITNRDPSSGAEQGPVITLASGT